MSDFVVLPPPGLPFPDEEEVEAVPRNVPVIPPLPVMPLLDSNPTVAKCGKCGLELKQVMWYVCPHFDCPCFSRVIC